MADTDDTAASVAKSRAAQGLPRCVDDPLTLDRLVELFRQTDTDTDTEAGPADQR